MRFGWLRSLFTPPPALTCPGCGAELVRWKMYDDERGYRVERLWTGCPVRRDADLAYDHANATIADRAAADAGRIAMRLAHEEFAAAAIQLAAARDKHYAGWRYGKVTPLKDVPK